jgi:O-antigen ligase
MDDRKALYKKIHYYLALLVAFCLPLGRFTALFIALMMLNWLLEGDLGNKFRTIGKSKLALLFIAFYVLHIIGMAYTDDMNAGLFDLQVKLSLLLFPVMLVSRPLDSYRIRNVFMAFIAGGIISSLVMLSRAVYTYAAYGENNFFYQAFSFLIHPSYLSMYFCLCIAWLLYNMLRRDSSNGIPMAASVATIIFFSFIIVLLSSKMGLLAMFFIYFGFMAWYIITRKKYITGLCGMAIAAALVFCLVRYVPEIRDRFNAAAAAISSSSENQADAESTAVRMLIWKAANQVISENFLLGAGTGDARQELVKEYEKRGMTGALEHKLNAHNEFYQVFVSIGFIGFLALMAGLLIPLSISLRQKNGVYMLFLLLLMLNFVPESMLETQAGVMFYGFFNSLLCFRKQ